MRPLPILRWPLLLVVLAASPTVVSAQSADNSPAQQQAGGPQGPGDGQDAGEQPADVWAKIPPLQPTGRYGDYILTPSGPGYYTLLDVVTGNYRSRPPKLPYGNTGLMAHSYFDSDFRYLDDPQNTETGFFDFLKRRHPTDSLMVTFGGEERIRTMDWVSQNMTGVNSRYVLQRTRDWVDVSYGERLRVYAEFIDARSTTQALTPASIDVVRTDFLNLFADVKVADVADEPLYVRGGRQELYYGSQRLVGRLDWANTDRTFEGVKAFWQSDAWSVDTWWVKPIGVTSNRHFTTEGLQNFEGVFATYRPSKSRYLDLYYLNLNNQGNVARGQGNALGGYETNAIGGRFGGDLDDRFLWDLETAIELGNYSNQFQVAGMSSTGVGYRFKNAWATPQLWLLYDWASGDRNPGEGGEHTTFNQLYNRGHHYFGYLDYVGRQNIRDLNQHFSLYPVDWWRFEFQNHIFRLDQARDALYDAGGNVLRQDLTGRAGTDVGDEIDFRNDIDIGKHLVLMVGYSKLFAGSFIKQTGNGTSPDLTYFQFVYRY